MRVLQVFRDGRRFEPQTQEPLLDGYQGNLQTVRIMAKMVKEDRTQLDLRRFVEREILKTVKGQNFAEEISRIFNFCQKKILYRKDPVKVERVADLWSCLYALNDRRPEGDCSIKSVALATMLALYGHKPSFVLIKQNPHSTNFNHIYVEIELNGQIFALDPTPEDAPQGYEPKFLKKQIYRIFQ